MRTRFVLLAAALLASACGTTPWGREDSGIFDGAAGDGARDARGDAVFAPGLCTPDPALLFRRTACRSEEHCPCGAHCELGECVATCGAAACPPDQMCDLFGRCVPAGQSLSSLGPPPVAPGVLVLRERTVDLPSADAVVTLGWRASERALGAVHAVAASGWQLQCAAGGAWAAECRWPALAVGQEQLVQARAMPGSPPSQPALVSVFHAEALAAVTLRPPPVPLGTAPPGTYRGTATLVDLDVASDSAGATALPPPFALEVELDAVVFVDTTSGAGVLRLDDPTGALHPARRWWGALQLDPSTGNGTLALPAQRYLHPATEGMPAPAAAVAGLERDVLATPESAFVRWDSGRRALSFLLPVRLDGVLEAGSSPRLRWRVLLAKSGELNPGLLAQPVPPPDTLGAIGRVGVASAWEGALRSLLRWRSNANLQDARDTLLTLGERVAPGGVWRFDACVAATPLSSVDWARLRDELFAAGAPQSAGGASRARRPPIDASIGEPSSPRSG